MERPSPESEYHPDPYGRVCHYSLYELAVRIQRAMHENGGKSEPFGVSPTRWEKLQQEQAWFNGGSPIGFSEGPQPNFIWRGTAVFPKEGASY